MNYRYPLSERLVAQALPFEEFANGAAQCHAQLKGGDIVSGLLISNATAIIAMREHTELPFDTEAIERLFQTEEDPSPTHRGGWTYFDEWRT
jgi:hypothetical protein